MFFGCMLCLNGALLREHLIYDPSLAVSLNSDLLTATERFWSQGFPELDVRRKRIYSYSE